MCMRILTFTNLYPSAVQPRHGIFIEQRVRHLLATGQVSVRVVAPAPWVPAPGRTLLGRHGVLADLPAAEQRNGVEIWRPRFFAVPKLTSWFNPVTMARSALPAVRALQRQQDFDLIDAHFVYPDGAAAVLLGSWLRKPVTVTARGTDINVFPRHLVPRAWIRRVLAQADALITVSGALRDAMLALGADPRKVSVLRNGVDLAMFTPRADSVPDFHRPTLISVGHLIPDKGQQFVIEALPQLPGARLVLVGDGPAEQDLRRLAARLGVADRITWTGTLGQAELAERYAAADVTVLASAREGMPNVLLESLACGTPVIATNVGGSPEVVSTAAAGVLMRERSAAGVVEAFHRLAAQAPDRAGVRAHARQFGWSQTSEGLVRLFERVIRHQDGGARAARPASR